MLATASAGGVSVGAPRKTASAKAWSWHWYVVTLANRSRRVAPSERTVKRWKYCGAVGLSTLSSPLEPTTRADIRRNLLDSIEQVIRPVWPVGKVKSATIVWSSPGDRA